MVIYQCRDESANGIRAFRGAERKASSHGEEVLVDCVFQPNASDALPLGLN